MSHAPEVERAEHLLDRMGERIGALAARSTQRVQQLGTRLRVGGASETKKKRPTAAGKREAKGQPQVEKAEAALDTLQQRVSLITGVAEMQCRRTVARIREGTEDIMAEAQEIRRPAPPKAPKHGKTR